MNYQEVKAGLKEYNQDEVSVFVDYLEKLCTQTDRNGQLKNKWTAYLKPDQVVGLYKKVAIDGLYIDGDTITLNFKGSVMVNYNYQAYKNKLLNIYPNTKFDLQNVYEGDDFSFRKESGKVYYSHELNNPFDNNRTLIGAYCIIKNERGEFIETINNDDITKMRNVAKTQVIWDKWFGEMVLKSVIKRACKRHFKDVVINIEELDNENYDIDAPDVDAEIRERIQNSKTLDDLNAVYGEFLNVVENEQGFLTLLAEKKAEIKGGK